MQKKKVSTLNDPFDRLPSNGKDGTNTIKVPLLNTKGGFTTVDTGAQLEKSRSGDYYNYALFADRFPKPSYKNILKNEYKSAALTTLKAMGDQKVAMLSDPYDNYTKAQLEDSYRKDDVVRHGLELYCYLLFGKRTKTVVDVNKEFMNIDIQEKILEETFSEQEVDESRNWCEKINRQVRFHQNVFALTLQSKLGGRAALGVEVNQKDIPVALKLLNWRKLGQVYADVDTWKFLAVDYADREKEDPLRAEEIIYLPHADYHVTPNALYYGLSAIEPILDVSQTNRIINQEDLKEGARIAWAQNGVVTFPPNTPISKIRRFMNEFRPGWNGTTLNVTIRTEGITVDMAGLINLRTANSRYMASGLRLPGLVMGIEEQVPNRSVAEMIMHVWRESELNYSRTWLQDYLETQWFDSLLQIRFPDIDLNEMWIKAKLEFQDITFESLKDRTEALGPLVQNNWIPLEKALDVWDMPDVKDQVQALQRKAEKERQQELEAMKLQQKAQQDIAEDKAKGGGGQFNEESSGKNEEPAVTEEDIGEDEDDDEEEKKKKRKKKKRAGRDGPSLKEAKLTIDKSDPAYATIQAHTVDASANKVIDMQELMNKMDEIMKFKQASINTTAMAEESAKIQRQEAAARTKMAEEEHRQKLELFQAFKDKLDKIGT